jgi:GntR family transcriptional regulator
MSDEIFLSNSKSTPMYGQIMEQIIAKVLAGDWRPGHALPSTRQLASSSNVSVITVKRAYLELERAGVIVTCQGKGSFVSENQDLPKQLALAEFSTNLDSMLDAAARLGMSSQEILGKVQEKLSVQRADVSQPNLSTTRGE